ncbi:hypothetical protein O166_11795 [Pseudogulbenkiania ferrooxidans EGD-HP2]|uniref:Uncharacterized protein n=1 Tax=Pseudogulbenkiania ferrooxidans EGD-HP2 TaxID=1388764 RepID=A0ABP2XJF5_9NEIS|nr:hypothetical protein O166_11795 [Pseudogulbenkiania ferrooxidans EGD-HP2]
MMTVTSFLSNIIVLLLLPCYLTIQMLSRKLESA